MTTGQEIRKWLNIGKRREELERRTVLLKVDNYVLHVIVYPDAMGQVELDEEVRKHVNLRKNYSGRIDPPHDSKTGQVHIQVFAGKKEIFALNVDGTAHDRSHKYPIPTVVAKEMERQLPQFKLPADYLIEWVDQETTRLLLD